ncbi:CLAVATA3/ESR (CLE)-related protein 46 [Argentina anserina]|uniref:CLAVATA3/ESR (CLE)-related protein 46 n=1 Tax=Argentina anserina TaxID=57926 RepID=UPI0021768193|nr:CLAVATA3/ESR (CLE)-related protein 46 [Potentilla anserina]
MGRQSHILLLFLCLLLATSQYHYCTINAQDLESVQFKLNPALRSSRPGSGTRYALPTKVRGRKWIHKSPSGPNPVGNHRPPSKQ